MAYESPTDQDPSLFRDGLSTAPRRALQQTPIIRAGRMRMGKKPIVVSERESFDIAEEYVIDG